jgi:hypothetical protein
MPAGYKNIAIKEFVFNKLWELYQKQENPKVVAFTTWLTEYLLENLEEDDYLQRYSPGLSFISAQENVVYIKDYFIDRIVEVEVHAQESKRFLYCRYCNKDDCLHIGFCFAIREVNKILVDKGFKKPRKQ